MRTRPLKKIRLSAKKGTIWKVLISFFYKCIPVNEGQMKDSGTEAQRANPAPAVLTRMTAPIQKTMTTSG
jgi:hypothetical protein